MNETINAINNWKIGLVSTQEIIDTAKKNGYKLNREVGDDVDVMHATAKRPTKSKDNFSIRIK